MRKLKYYLPTEPVTKGPKHHFFGFNDLCPWDASGRFILALETDFVNHIPKTDDKAIIGIIDLADNKRFYSLASTNAWNFQQGARLQWVSDKADRIIYNIRNENNFVSVILNVKTKESQVLPLPIYTISPDGNYALTLNFAKLYRLGGYGYAGVRDVYEREFSPKNDGIYKIDLRTGDYELIISIADVANFGTIASATKNTYHYFTHILFNPTGDRFCFLHRFYFKDGGICSRLIISNPDGSQLYCLAEGNLSHFDWYNSKQILIWGRRKKFLTKIRQSNISINPIYRYLLSFSRSKIKGFLRQHILGDQYLLLHDKMGNVKSIGVGVLTEDGHCSFSPNGNWILTDTYADKRHYRTLLLYNLKKNRRIDVGRFYSLPDKKFRINEDWDTSGMRCDLHPRWNREGTQICIDSVHEGTRQMYVLEVDKVING